MTKRNNYLLKRYGITEKQYEDLYQRQDGRCAVCGRHADRFRTRLSVDHDHASGEIRGLLCIHCNRYVVGKHRREKGAELLWAAYQYLVREYPGWIVPKKKIKRKRKKKR